MIATGLDRLLADPARARRPALRPAGARRLGDGGLRAGAPRARRGRECRRRGSSVRSTATTASSRTWCRPRARAIRGPASRSSRSTATTRARSCRAPRRSPGSTCCSSTCRTSARATTPTPRPRSGPPRRRAPPAARSGSSTARTRSVARSSRATSREPGFASFVGAFRMPVRHGLTLGEIVRLEARRRQWGRLPKVLAVEGWRRERPLAGDRPSVDRAVAQHADATRRRWSIPGSACSRRPSSRRGAARPGRSCSSARPASARPRSPRRCRRSRAMGVAAVPTYFRPQFQKHRGEVCGGVELVIRRRDQGAGLPPRPARSCSP